MAIASLTAYKTALNNAPEILPVVVGSATVVAGRSYDLWRAMLPQGAVPSTAVVPDNTTLGALGQQNGGSGNLAILASRWNNLNPGLIVVCDRLSHQGGLSGTTTGAQTTNLPTAALTRYTNGEGVMIGLTVYTAIGSTGTTVTVSYTNQAGSSGQTSLAVVMGGTGFNAANRMIQIPLAGADYGVRSVESVTLAGTTGTAGNFGVTLFKPLLMIGAESSSGMASNGFVTGGNFGLIPTIVDGACLMALAVCGATNAMGSGALIITEYAA
jgi:hypothetical protein